MGQVVESSWDPQVSDWHYRVQFGTGIRGVPASDLELLPESKDLIEEIVGGRFSNADNFRRLLTYERLRKPPSRVAASFGSAKAAFYPFQFVPLLKFLESPNQRILIADDVGLGKTIEAGYVLRELRARHGLQRILIVVPAQLREKWKRELERRFSEQFEIVGGASFRALRSSLENGREPDSFRWIASYEAVRSLENIDFFDEYKPPIDLAILDEAHRLRHPGTLQARFGRALAEAVDALLLLTATPVQTNLDDLFWLLHLLDGDRFSSPQVFSAQIEANRPVLRALSAIRKGAGGFDEARSELETLRKNPLTRPLTSDPFFEEILRRLKPTVGVGRKDLVALQREVSELSLTGSVVTRTRKSEVYPDRLPRRAQVVLIPLKPVEKSVYDAIGHLFQVLRPELSRGGLTLALTTLYRMAGSCLPSAAGRFHEFIRHRLSPELLAAEYDVGDDTADRLRDGSPLGADQLLEMLSRILLQYEAGAHGDSKFDLFLEAIRGVWADDSGRGQLPRKIIVFSTFLSTISYLDRRLGEAGVSHVRIDGSVPLREREAILEAFQSDENQLLLSSEVGSEGIDLQFASVIVNYDLPWNPMVVEQRIGRVDRIGQENPIVILNLVLQDTIEERILHRLFDRIGLFQDTIGDLEPILGEGSIEQLLVEILSSSLTREEEERRTEERERAILQERKNAAIVAREADTLLAADQAFLDEIEGLTGGRRIPTPKELLDYLRGVLDAHFPGCDVPLGLLAGAMPIRVTGHVVAELRRMSLDPEVARVAGILEGDSLLATFSQKVALNHPRADLVHARHPLIRFASDWIARRAEDPFRGFQLAIEEPVVSAGEYALGVIFLEVLGSRPSTDLRAILLALPGLEALPDEDAQALLGNLLDRGTTPSDSYIWDSTVVQHALRKIRELANRERQLLQMGEATLGEARAARRRTTLENTLRARVAAAEQRLASLKARGARDFAMRMAGARVSKVRRELESRFEGLTDELRPRVEDEEVLLALVRVGNPR